jgi:condensin complex subunit 1
MAVEARECSQQELGKLFFLLGHVALKQLVYIEEIQSELRRRRGEKEEQKKVNYKIFPPKTMFKI